MAAPRTAHFSQTHSYTCHWAYRRVRVRIVFTSVIIWLLVSIWLVVISLVDLDIKTVYLILNKMLSTRWNIEHQTQQSLNKSLTIFCRPFFVSLRKLRCWKFRVPNFRWKTCPDTNRNYKLSIFLKMFRTEAAVFLCWLRLYFLKLQIHCVNSSMFSIIFRNKIKPLFRR